MDREERKEFFTHLSKMVNDHPGMPPAEILQQFPVVVKDYEWALQMVERHLERQHKTIIPDKQEILHPDQEISQLSDIPETFEIPEYCEETEIFCDTPAMNQQGSFLFQSKQPPYRMRLVTPEFSIIY